MKYCFIFFDSPNLQKYNCFTGPRIRPKSCYLKYLWIANKIIIIKLAKIAINAWFLSQIVLQKKGIATIHALQQKLSKRDRRFNSLFVQGRLFGNAKQTNAVSFCNIWCFVIDYHKAPLHLVWFHKCWYMYSLSK